MSGPDLGVGESGSDWQRSNIGTEASCRIIFRIIRPDEHYPQSYGRVNSHWRPASENKHWPFSSDCPTPSPVSISEVAVVLVVVSAIVSSPDDHLGCNQYRAVCLLMGFCVESEERGRALLVTKSLVFRNPLPKEGYFFSTFSTFFPLQSSSPSATKFFWNKYLCLLFFSLIDLSIYLSLSFNTYTC